jgi:hypothetical protein
VGALAGVAIIGLRARRLGLHDVVRADLHTIALFLLLVALSCGVPWALAPRLELDVAYLTAAACPLVCVPLLVRVLRRARQLRRS